MEGSYVSIVSGRKGCYHLFHDENKIKKRPDLGLTALFYCKQYGKRCFDIFNGIFSNYYDERQRAFYIQGGIGGIISRVEKAFSTEILRGKQTPEQMIEAIKWELCRLSSYNSIPSPNTILIDEIKRQCGILEEEKDAEKDRKKEEEKKKEEEEKKKEEERKKEEDRKKKEEKKEEDERKKKKEEERKTIIIEKIKPQIIEREKIVYVEDKEKAEELIKSKKDLERLKTMIITQENEMKNIEFMKEKFDAHISELQERYETKLIDVSTENKKLKGVVAEKEKEKQKIEREKKQEKMKSETEIKQGKEMEKKSIEDLEKIKKECLSLQIILEEKSKELGSLKLVIEQRDFSIKNLSQKVDVLEKEKNELIIDKAEFRGQLKEKTRQIDGFMENIQNMRKEVELGETKIIKLEEETDDLKKELEKYKKVEDVGEDLEKAKKLDEMRKRKQEIMARLFE